MNTSAPLNEVFLTTCERDLNLHKQLLAENAEVADRIAEQIWNDRFKKDPPRFIFGESEGEEYPACLAVLEWLQTDLDGKICRNDVMNLYGLASCYRDAENILDKHIVHFADQLLLEFALSADKEHEIDWEEIETMRNDMKLFLDYREKEKAILRAVKSGLRYYFEEEASQNC